MSVENKIQPVVNEKGKVLPGLFTFDELPYDAEVDANVIRSLYSGIAKQKIKEKSSKTDIQITS